MITSPSTAKRLLIPRWRSFADTLASGELASPKDSRKIAATSSNQAELLRRKDRWHHAPSEITAAELVESAIIFGAEELASSAAQFLTSVHANVTPLVRRQSQQLLCRLHQGTAQPDSAFEAQHPSVREQLKDAPDNPILWVELALRQLTTGANDNAVRSMRTALQLAADNRFVLRSAARLFSHLRTPDVGYQLLRRSPATEYDPWLMSAEIALAARLEKRPQFLRKGLGILDSHLGGRLDLSELAGAAATTFLDGNIPKRQARLLFQQSLTVPTDSAVAQAEWASQAVGERFFEIDRVPLYRQAKEAQALHAYSVGDYAASLKSAKAWIREEPYSSRAHAAAAAAANTIDDYSEAISACETGLRYDPRSPSLRNSLAFALACSGRLSDAEQALSQMKFAAQDPVSDLVAEANRGLIAFRNGNLLEGQTLYQKAINGFKRRGQEFLATAALAYYAREASIALHPKAKEIVSEAQESIRQKKHPVAARVLSQVQTKVTRNS